MTPNDLYFVLCLLAPLMWFRAPMSERRTYKAVRQTRAKQVKQTKARKPKKQKRTKAKKTKRYKAPPLSVEQQMMYDQYKLKQSGVLWNSGEHQ